MVPQPKDIEEQIPRFIMLASRFVSALRATCNEKVSMYFPDEVGYPVHAAVRLADGCLELKSVVFNGVPLKYIGDAEYFRRLNACRRRQGILSYQSMAIRYRRADVS